MITDRRSPMAFHLILSTALILAVFACADDPSPRGSDLATKDRALQFLTRLERIHKSRAADGGLSDHLLASAAIAAAELGNSRLSLSFCGDIRHSDLHAKMLYRISEVLGERGALAALEEVASEPEFLYQNVFLKSRVGALARSGQRAEIAAAILCLESRWAQAEAALDASRRIRERGDLKLASEFCTMAGRIAAELLVDDPDDWSVRQMQSEIVIELYALYRTDEAQQLLRSIPDFSAKCSAIDEIFLIEMRERGWKQAIEIVRKTGGESCSGLRDSELDDRITDELIQLRRYQEAWEFARARGERWRAIGAAKAAAQQLPARESLKMLDKNWPAEDVVLILAGAALREANQGNRDLATELTDQALSHLPLEDYSIDAREVTCTLAIACAEANRPEMTRPLLDKAFSLAENTHGPDYQWPGAARVRGFTEVAVAAGRCGDVPLQRKAWTAAWTECRNQFGMQSATISEMCRNGSAGLACALVAEVVSETERGLLTEEIAFQTTRLKCFAAYEDNLKAIPGRDTMLYTEIGCIHARLGTEQLW